MTKDGGAVPSPRFGDAVAPWHIWFAWRPVRTWDFRWVWLRKVRRRLIQLHWYLYGGPEHWWQYALIAEDEAHAGGGNEEMSEVWTTANPDNQCFVGQKGVLPVFAGYFEYASRTGTE